LDKNALEALKTKIKPKFTFNSLGKAKFNVERNLKLTLSQQQRKDPKTIVYGDVTIHYFTILLNVDLFI
jgi:hypothetical protein